MPWYLLLELAAPWGLHGLQVGITRSSNVNIFPPEAGGGMYNSGDSNPALTNVTFFNKSAGYGGEMDNDWKGWRGNNFTGPDSLNWVSPILA